MAESNDQSGASLRHPETGTKTPSEAETPVVADATLLNRDQQAIDNYFRSTTFARGKVLRGEQIDQRSSTPIRDWFLDVMVPVERDLSPISSYWFGLLGLNVLLIVFATVFPISVHLIEDYINNNQTFIFMMFFLQGTMFPAIIAFSFATVTPMFWYGSVLLRFASGVVSVLPGIMAFIVSLALVEEVSFDDDFFLGFASVMYAQFVAAGVVAVTVQMWSPFTLTHARDPESPLPGTGTRALVDLTGIAALGFAISVVADFEDYIVGMLIFGGFGLISSLGVIIAFITFMTRHRWSRFGAVVVVGCAFVTSMLLCGVVATEMFGWESIWYNLLLVSSVALFGTMIVCVVTWLCIAWLRRCGWRCVRRDEERRRVQQLQESRLLMDEQHVP